MLEAEKVLMATGLLERPTATHVRASRTLFDDMKKEMIDALDREDPGRLYVCPERVSYFDRLSNPPVYDTWGLVLEPLIGTTASDAYKLLHQNARKILLDLRPAASIDTVLGPVPMPLDSISTGRWAIEVDVVEGLRVPKDFAAGALLKEEIDVFSACFPAAYAELFEALNTELNKRSAADQSWQPPLWLADAIRVFERKPFGAPIELKASKPPPPPVKPAPGKALDTEALKTRSQQT